MRKILILSLIFLMWAKPALSLSQFNTDYQITYEIGLSGLTKVKYQISQTNNLSRVYATEFSLSVSHTDIENLKVKDMNDPIDPEVIHANNITSINFPFINKIVGKDKIHTFFIEYETNDIAVKTGSVWEVNIPKITTNEAINNLVVKLQTPANFPKLAYIDPKPSNIVDGLYIFSSHSLANKPISAIFGSEQYFKLSASYFLSNNQNTSINQTIALPPNTSYQEIYIKSIDPKPDNISLDPDGNWLATYTLKPKQELNINLDQIIRLSFTPKKETNIPNLTQYQQPTKTWNYNSPEFQKVNLSQLKDPQQIFNYVTSSLVYNYSLINKDPLQRQTASFSLEHPTQAICTNFTDLFVALARKNNIPSREIQGFAMSKNEKLKPLSLSKDVLHAWPEYYSKEENTWIQVDPTWTNTTNGVDYFNKLDLNHLTFVIHGQDTTYPLPAGFYKNPNKTSKDVVIVETNPIEFPQANIQVEVKRQKGNTLIIGVTNLSGTAKLNIPPLSYQEQEIDLNSRPIVGISTKTVTVEIAGDQYTLPVSIKPLLQPQTLITVLIALLMLIILIIKKIKKANSVFPVSIKT